MREIRQRLGGGGRPFRRPTAQQQRQRLERKFQQIASGFVDLQATVQGIEPEQVIVLETVAKSIDGLASAAARVPGLEWVAELDLGETDPGDGFEDAQDSQRKLGRRLYALFTNQRAIQRLLRLWQEWYTAPDQRARRNFGPFKNVFLHLKEVRRWSVQDRLAETGILEYWEENLASQQQVILSEVELWSHQDSARRERAYHELERRVQEAGGRCVAQSAIPEILYHGVLIELPPAAVRETIDRVLAQQDTQLVRCEEVMFFRAGGQARFHRPEAAVTSIGDRLRAAPLPTGDPVLALLDGLPIMQHVALAGRAVVDDPEDAAAQYEPQHQYHGTAMASILIHGDLGKPEIPLSRPIYVRAIYRPFFDLDGNLAYEGTPPDCLLVDLFHRAVRRIKDGEGNQPAIAPSVRVINLSFGDRYQPFITNLSPLARLLDWLAQKYNVLFLVSAGNQMREVVVPLEQQEWRGLDRQARARHIVRAMRSDQALRRPFSPSEAISAVSVGAIHAGESGTIEETDLLIDLLGGRRLPSPLSTVASGFKRSVKPEILLPGGRQLYQIAAANNDSTCFRAAVSAPIGILVAAPGQRPLELDRIEPLCGTSNATALASRFAHLILDRLELTRNEAGGDRISERFMPVLVKTLLVHGASWGDSADQLAAFFDDVGGRELTRLQSRFLGYGEVILERCLFSTGQRVVLLGWDAIRDGEGHVYELPLPPSLSANRIQRRLTVSLGWLSPVNPRHKDYRKASLWAHVPEEMIGVSKKELDFDSTKRGTLQHRVFEGEQAVVFGDRLRITISCKEEAGDLPEAVPYALAVTLEVAESIGIDLYNEISLRVRPEVPIAATS